MKPPPSTALAKAALVLATGAAVSVLFSNAVCQILLGAALLTLLVARQRLRLPPIGLPLALFFLGTLVSLALSPDPAAGLPQIKKFYVFLILPVVYTALPGVRNVLHVLVAWAILASASGLWSFVQFWQKRQEALSHGWNFYLHYVANRATGFMSHWMTFSAEEMVTGATLSALLLFGVVQRQRLLAVVALGIIGTSIVIVQTRSVWGGSAVAIAYLIAVWRPKLLFLAPVLAGVLWFVVPVTVQERIVSIWRPHGTSDSNDHRRIVFRTGAEMIRAHPWFGLGPEIPKREFMKYKPADIPLPLPEGFYGHLHNVYIQYAAERGIPTLMAMLWVIGKTLSDFARSLRNLLPEERLRRAILHGAIAAILGILVEGFAEHNLGDSEVLTMFLVVIACGYIAAFPREPVHA